MVADYNALLERADRLSKSLPANARDAFYELVLHPIQASATVNDLYVTVAKNRLFAQQGHDLKSLMRSGASDAELRNEIAALWQGRGDRYSEMRTAETAALRKVEMSYIGG